MGRDAIEPRASGGQLLFRMMNALAVAMDNPEFGFGGGQSRMTSVQWQVMLPDEALAVAKCRFQIAHLQWQAAVCKCALAVASDAPKSRTGSAQERSPMSQWLWQMILQNVVLAVANDTPEQRLCGCQK